MRLLLLLLMLLPWLLLLLLLLLILILIIADGTSALDTLEEAVVKPKPSGRRKIVLLLPILLNIVLLHRSRRYLDATSDAQPYKIACFVELLGILHPMVAITRERVFKELLVDLEVLGCFDLGAVQ